MIHRKCEPGEEIVDLVRRGDREAMNALYCRYAGYLAAVGSRYVIDNDDLKDVLHDAFLKIFSSVSSFYYRGENSFKSWMSRIVVNEALKFLRRDRRNRFVEIDDLADDFIDDEPDVSEIPADEIFRMIRELPTGYRTVFNLSVVDGLSHREIATMLGIKETTSASQLHRAKALLAKMIKKYNDQ